MDHHLPARYACPGCGAKFHREDACRRHCTDSKTGKDQWDPKVCEAAWWSKAPDGHIIRKRPHWWDCDAAWYVDHLDEHDPLYNALWLPKKSKL